MTEIMDIINEQDEVIGKTSKENIRKDNILHRGVTIILLNSKGEILIHKRTANKDIYPSTWDVLCGGGVQSGETYDQAAERETREEVGIQNPRLKFLFKFRYKSETDNYWTQFYSCVYDGKLEFQKEEIEKGYFVTPDNLEKMLKEKEFCHDSVEIYRKYQEMQKT